MKIKIDIECTPEEAREFMGLPNIAPMQDALMEEIQKKLEENIKNMDPETLMKTWVPLTMQGMSQGMGQWGEMQKMFWQNLNMKPPSSGKDE